MRKLLFGLCAGFVTLLLCGAQAFAAGYGIYEWSARGNALGGTLIARADDPSAVAYNPAGITQLPGVNVMGGVTAIAPNATVRTNGRGEDGKGANSIWGIPHAYYTHQLSDSAWFGFGAFSRVGLGTEYIDDEKWGGRYNCTYAGLKSVSFNPNLAFKVTDALSVAAGVEIITMEFAYDKAANLNASGSLPPSSDPAFYDVKTKTRATGWAPGWNLGLHYKPLDWLAFGATYRSQIDLTVEGKTHFSANPGAAAVIGGSAPLQSMFGHRTNTKGTEPIPAATTFGVMVKPIDRLSIEVDAVHTDWSSYSHLTFEYDNALGERTSEKNWSDAWRYQVGAEYRLLDWLDLRAGYIFDESPINPDYADYAVPANDRQMLTTGVGMRFDEWTVDLSYGYLWMKNRDIKARPAEGVLDSTIEGGHSHLIGLSVGYSF
ncbi:long-chain fatty acid transport protein [Desulfobaculum xiamenense]|uniref:Long-chain fatty acid transport protein n=1 Tax=Desulfobaculum xiamenense TaxID=995050 RepID=A0A846QWW4_9BACT|nr:OmpP1/FadL family transporter [Desulfobaculum xiamenense]NJB69109.1 long-chain fatty acid transport protein [Desulfobaculum xiamenense]